MKRPHALVAAMSALVLSICTPLAHAASDTMFTYQGKLSDGGSPANGNYNIDVSLWNSLAGGTQIGVTNHLVNVPIAGGLLTINVDFGGDAFNNSARWLQFAVAGTPLAPRQSVAPTPYALQTRGIVVNSSGQVGIGTAGPQSKVDIAVAGDGAELLRLSTERPWVFKQYLTGPSTGLQLQATSGLKTFDIVAMGGTKVVTFLADDANPRVGIGTDMPTSRLHVESGDESAFYCRRTATSGGGQCIQGRDDSTAGVGVLGWVSAASGVSYGVYGRSNSSRGFDFFAGGAGINYGAASSIRWKQNIESISHSLDMLEE